MARRYLPFILLAAVQLLLALTVPSIAPDSDRVQLGGALPPGLNDGPVPGDPNAPLDPDAPIDPNAPLDGDAPADADASVDANNDANNTAGQGAQSGSGSGTSPGTSSRGSAQQPGALQTPQLEGGDRRHCTKDGRQYGELEGAPPCVGKFPDDADNGGATSAGVTRDEIRFVYYRNQDNPAVNALLVQADLASTAEQEKAFLAAAAKFINARYETYNRKVRFIFFQGNCSTAPPVDSCFRDEAKTIAKKFQPFGVMWANNTNAPAFHDQLSRLGIVNLGGWHFSDRYRTDLRPYSFDVFMGGDFQARLTGDYWCKRLAGKPAKYAGAEYRRTKRKVAILYPDNAVLEAPAQLLLTTIRKCDSNGPQILAYSPNIDQAAQQSTAFVAKLKRDGVTSVMIFGDPIAPAYLTNAATQQAYFPEHVLVGSGLIDYDLLARLYDPEQWRHAFGVSDLTVFVPHVESDANIVWKSAGGEGTVNNTANGPWGYLATIATGVQFSGANVNPLTFERALLSIDVGGWFRVKNPMRYYLKTGKGDYTIISDAKEAYWDASATSRIDGKRGAYIAAEGGRRFRIGEWTSGDPRLPAGFGQ